MAFSTLAPPLVNDGQPVMDFTPRIRAWSALNYLQEHPETWNQWNWFYCFAGTVVRQSGVRVENLTWMDVRDNAMRLLEIDERKAGRLFAGRNSMRTLTKLTKRYFGKDPFAS